MTKNLHTQLLTLFTLIFAFQFNATAATFTSVQNGDWHHASTWAEAGYPSAADDVVIKDGHTVTITGHAYTFYGNLLIESQAELIVDAGDHKDGLIYCGYDFYVFGKLTFTEDKDFAIIGESHFWGHPGAEIWVTDDWKVGDHTLTTVDAICVRVDDDFHLIGSKALVCGNGGVSVGGNTIDNTVNLYDGAAVDQICRETTIYRSSGGSTCHKVFIPGKGNNSPVATNDRESTPENIAVTIDVLDQGTADFDPDGDDLFILSVGTNFSNNQATKEGGTAIIDANGTNDDPTDDFIRYTPALDFVGTDEFTYVISDDKGGVASAIVVIEVNASLPVELVNFKADEARCEVDLAWATAAELNNSHFEVERSIDGYNFKKIGEIAGNGTSNQYHVYDFTDALPTGENYYRLKQVDYDGTSTYSDVIFKGSDCAQNKNSIGIVKVFPNPVLYNEVSMRFEAKENENAILSITDLYGKTIIRQEVEVQNGMNDFKIEVADLRAGTYLMTLGRQTTKFIKAID